MQTNLQKVNQKLHSLSSREKTLLIIAGMLIIFVLFWQFVFQPYQQERERLLDEIELTAQQNEQILSQLDEWETYKSEVDDAESQLKELEKELPGYQELEYTFYQIATIFYRQDISFDTIFFNLSDRADEISQVELQGNLEGNYINIHDTLTELEDMDRLVNVNTLSINALDDSAMFNQEDGEFESQEVSVAFEMQFYWDDIAITDPNELDTGQIDIGKLDPFIQMEQ